MTQDELRRYYAASDGDFALCLASVKETIHWRQKYTLFSAQELEAWASFVFWHGSDVMQRPCLIVRIGLAADLTSKGQEQFVRAVGKQFYPVFSVCFLVAWSMKHNLPDKEI